MRRCCPTDLGTPGGRTRRGATQRKQIDRRKAHCHACKGVGRKSGKGIITGILFTRRYVAAAERYVASGAMLGYCPLPPVARRTKSENREFGVKQRAKVICDRQSNHTSLSPNFYSGYPWLKLGWLRGSGEGIWAVVAGVVSMSCLLFAHFSLSSVLASHFVFVCRLLGGLSSLGLVSRTSRCRHAMRMWLPACLLFLIRSSPCNPPFPSLARPRGLGWLGTGRYPTAGIWAANLPGCCVIDILSPFFCFC
jgi:hypothetical protein